MFKVVAQTRAEYFAFDPARRAELEQLDAFIQQTAPRLNAYFFINTVGMKANWLGYGGKEGKWPLISLLLQKNYFSVYVSGKIPLEPYNGRLGKCRIGKKNVFSFKKLADLNLAEFAKLLHQAEEVFDESDTYVAGAFKQAVAGL